MFRSKNRPITCPDSRSLITFNRSSIPLLDVTVTKLSTLRLESMIEQLDRETINKETYSNSLDPCFEGVSYVFSSHRAWRIATISFERSFRTFSICHVTSDRRLQAWNSSIDQYQFIVRFTSQIRFFQWIHNKRDTASIKSDFLQSLFNLLVSFIE